jgi:SulP family sulfate permease
MHTIGDLLVFRSLKGWRAGDLGGDLVAGLTLAAIAIPEQMATARLAGFAPEIGFLAFIVGAVAFAIFGASRYISVGADSTIAPIFAGSLSILAVTGSSAYATLAATLALLVGAVLVLSGLLRMGWVANLLSVPVTTGFLAGIAVHIVVSQLPALLGIHAPSGDNFLHHIVEIGANSGQANLNALLLGLGVFSITFASEKISPRIPGALIGVLIATLAVILFHLESRGVSVLGVASGGIPHLTFPDIKIDDVTRLAALALVVSIVVMVQTAATARAFTPEKDGPPDVNRDFIGVGTGSVLSSFFGVFPVNASPPRTAVALESGGRSQITGLLAAVIVGLLIVFGPTLLAHVPTAALSGILLFVAQRITRLSVFVQIYRKSKGEFSLIAATLIAIVMLPIQVGVAAGIFLSLLHGVWTTTRTRIIEFERVPGTSVWWPPNNPSKGEKIDGIMVLAFQAPLSFLNVYEFRSGFLDAIHGSRQQLRAVVLEASSIIEIDFTASQVLAEMIEHCRASNILFAIARLESVRGQQALERFGIIDLLGRGLSFRTVQEAIDALARVKGRRPENGHVSNCGIPQE